MVAACSFADSTITFKQVAQTRADLALAEAQLALALSSHDRSATLAADGVVAET